MDVYEISNLRDVKGGTVKKWTLRQRIKASRQRSLLKILECEISILNVKFPFLNETQIKGIALNWIGIPTIMGHIPNSQVMDYVVPAENKKNVMAMVRLLLSKRKPTKRDEHLLNVLSDMILNSCTHLTSHNYTSSEKVPKSSESDVIGTEPVTADGSATPNSNRTLTGVNNNTSSLHEQHTHPETSRTNKKVILKNLEARTNQIRRLMGPGCGKIRKERDFRAKNTSKDNSVYSDISGSPPDDEILETVTQTATDQSAENQTTTTTEELQGATLRTTTLVTSADNSQSPLHSEDNIMDSCIHSPSVTVSNEEQNITNQKSVTEPQESSTTATDTRQQNHVSNTTDPSAAINEHSTTDSKLVSELQTNKDKGSTCGDETNQTPSLENTPCGSDFTNINSGDYANATDITTTMTNEVTNQEAKHKKMRKVTATAMLKITRANTSSADSVKHIPQDGPICSTDLSGKSNIETVSQPSNDDIIQGTPLEVRAHHGINTVLGMVEKPTKRRKYLKVSATDLLMIHKGSAVVNSSEISEVNSEKDKSLEISEPSHNSCTAPSPTPSSKMVSQELAHLSPIEYLSLEPYSSGLESGNEKEEYVVEQLDSADLLVDLFNPISSDSNQTARIEMAAEAVDEGTILSLGPFDPKE